ncbi:MAG TPA: hypothetical protein VIR02_09520 [Anaerolineales bacterium]|jgi:hypothetical protein
MKIRITMSNGSEYLFEGDDMEAKWTGMNFHMPLPDPPAPEPVPEPAPAPAPERWRDVTAECTIENDYCKGRQIRRNGTDVMWATGYRVRKVQLWEMVKEHNPMTAQYPPQYGLVDAIIIEKHVP